MALSNSKDYTNTFTAASIVALALRRLGVLDPDETIDATEEANALVTLNLMVKEWAAYGIDNWLRQAGVVWITDPGERSTYTLGPSGSPAAFSWYETELAADAASGATSITVAAIDSTHSVNGANIGVKLDDGSIDFTTISGSPTTTITLTASLDSAASSGNRVYIYNTSSQIARPCKLLWAAVATADTTNTSIASTGLFEQETELKIIGRTEYERLNQKRQVGVPNQVHYEQSLTNGTLHLWPTGTTGKDYDKIYFVSNIYPDDFDATSNNAQFPPEWHNALAWNLAAEMAAEYGLPESEQRRLWSIANGKLGTLLDYDVENASVLFGRDVR